MIKIFKEKSLLYLIDKEFKFQKKSNLSCFHVYLILRTYIITPMFIYGVMGSETD